MKKALIEVKRLNSNDTIATSTKTCTADLSKFNYFIQSNGPIDRAIIGAKDGNSYSYNGSKFVKLGSNIAYYTSGISPTLKDGKWYHVFSDSMDFDSALVVECPNPQSHNLPKDRE